MTAQGKAGVLADRLAKESSLRALLDLDKRLREIRRLIQELEVKQIEAKDLLDLRSKMRALQERMKETDLTVHAELQPELHREVIVQSSGMSADMDRIYPLLQAAEKSLMSEMGGG